MKISTSLSGLVAVCLSTVLTTISQAASAGFDLGIDALNLQPGFTALGTTEAPVAGPLNATVPTVDVASGSIKVTLAAGANLAAATEWIRSPVI